MESKKDKWIQLRQTSVKEQEGWMRDKERERKRERRINLHSSIDPNPFCSHLIFGSEEARQV